MIPNQNSITLEGIRPMLIQRYAGHTKFDYLNIESLDTDLFDFLDEDMNHELIEQLTVGDWIHVDFVGFVPNPELDKALWELTKLYAKYDLISEDSKDI